MFFKLNKKTIICSFFFCLLVLNVFSINKIFAEETTNNSIITEEDIKAKYENGTLTLNFPKNQDKIEAQKKFINIEG